MKKFKTIKVPVDFLEPPVVPYVEGGLIERSVDTVERVLVPPEIRKDLHVNTEVHPDVIATMPEDVLAQLVYERLAETLAKTLLDYMVIEEYTVAEFGSKQYVASITIEDLKMLEERNEEV